MQLFYGIFQAGGKVLLEEEESRHATGVLRKKEGDLLQVTDGLGRMYTCRLAEIHKRHAVLDIVEAYGVPQQQHGLHIALAPTKNMDRTEWFVEKCTEIGTGAFHFLWCDRSERRALKTERIEKVMFAAAKQSLTTYFPEIHEPVDFRSFIQQDFSEYNCLLATCEEQQIPRLSKEILSNKKTLLLIGPEGDFTPAEIAAAQEKGFRTLSLGNTRLRTETAGIVACTLYNALQQPLITKE